MLLEDIENYSKQLSKKETEYNEELFGIIDDMNGMPSVPQPHAHDMPRTMPSPKKYESSSSDTSIEEIRARAESIRKQFS